MGLLEIDLVRSEAFNIDVKFVDLILVGRGRLGQLLLELKLVTVVVVALVLKLLLEAHNQLFLCLDLLGERRVFRLRLGLCNCEPKKKKKK